MADETIYNPNVSFRIKISKVFLLTAEGANPATYRLSYTVEGLNDLGAMDTVLTTYILVDYIGVYYTILAVGSGTLDVEDSLRTGECPTSNENATIIETVGDGTAPFLSPASLQFHHPLAKDNINKWNLDIIWRTGTPLTITSKTRNTRDKFGHTHKISDILISSVRGKSSFLIGGYSATDSLATIDTDLALTYLGNTYGSEFSHFFYLNKILFGSGWNAAYTETFFKYSLDLGVTWTDVPTTIYEPTNTGLVSGMAWNGVDKYVLTITGDLLTNTLAYSSDGMTWTGAGNTVFALGARCVIWDGAKFIAGGDGTDDVNSLAYSTNGTSWTGLGYTSDLLGCNSIAFNGDSTNPIYVAVGASPTTPNSVMRSTDGLTWTGVGTPAFNFAGYKVIYANDRFIAVGVTYISGDIVAYSVSGTDWTSSFNASSSIILLDIVWLGDKYIIAGYEGAVSILKYSINLIDYVDITDTFEYITTIFEVAGTPLQDILDDLADEAVIDFTADATPSIESYNTTYASRFGQYPKLLLLIDDGSGNDIESSAMPIRYRTAGLITRIEWDLGTEYTGKIILYK